MALAGPVVHRGCAALTSLYTVDGRQLFKAAVRGRILDGLGCEGIRERPTLDARGCFLFGIVPSSIPKSGASDSHRHWTKLRGVTPRLVPPHARGMASFARRPIPSESISYAHWYRAPVRVKDQARDDVRPPLTAPGDRLILMGPNSARPAVLVSGVPCPMARVACDRLP